MLTVKPLHDFIIKLLFFYNLHLIFFHQANFKNFDSDNSGCLNSYELRSALRNAGEFNNIEISTEVSFIVFTSNDSHLYCLKNPLLTLVSK